MDTSLPFHFTEGIAKSLYSSKDRLNQWRIQDFEKGGSYYSVRVRAYLAVIYRHTPTNNTISSPLTESQLHKKINKLIKF